MSPVRLPLPLADAQALIASLANAPLDSSTLDAKPIAAPLERTQSFESDVVPVTANVRGQVQISLFNSLDDRDPDAILVPPGEKDPFGLVGTSLTLSADRAWLKYRTEAGLKASGAKTLADIGFMLSAEANASAVLADYRVHKRSESARDAVVADLEAGPRFALVLADVERLTPGDAVAIQIGGTLRASVTLAWSDVFVGELAPLSALLKSSALIVLTFDAGATLTANVALTDDFLIVFSRVDDATWQVGVKKAECRSIGVGLQAGIDVTFAAPKAVEQVVNGLVDKVVGAPPASVKRLLDKATLDDLSPKDRELARSLLRRLGLDETSATREDLKKRVDEVRASIVQTVSGIAKAKISAGFAYEYQRVNTSVHLLQATLSREALRDLHDTLIRGNLQPTLTAVLNARPGVTLQRYLNEKSVERKHSWGFTLGIGKWFSIAGTDSRTIRPVVRRDFQDRRQESYLGLRGYEGHWMKDTVKWSADFNAEMATFARDPLVSHFALGIHLSWEHATDHLSETDVDTLLDAAVLWGVMTQLDAASVRPQLVAQAGRPCEASVQMTIADRGPRTAFRTMLASLDRAPGIAAALGAAMPWQAGSIGRTHVAVRRNLYAPLWQRYLDAPEMSPSLLAASAQHAFADGDFADLGFEELQFRARRVSTFAGLAELNPGTPARAKGFRGALDTLRAALDSGAPGQPTLGSAFHDLSAFWEQSHHIRAAGAYLLEAARTARVLDDVGRTATFTIDGKALVLG